MDDRSRPAVRSRAEALIAAAWIALLAARFVERRGTLVALGADALPEFTIGDDAFYYLQVAWNWSRGLGSTFDGIHATNGYQPLWEWLLAAVASLFASKVAFLGFVQWLVLVLHAAIAVALFLVIGRRTRPAAGALAAWLWLFAQPLWCQTFAMESDLYALLLVACFALWSRRETWARDRTPAADALIGLFLGLLLLARLDASLLVVLLLATATIEALVKRVRWSAPIATAAGVATLVVPYLAGNAAVFGSALPVSVLVHHRGAGFHAETLVRWVDEVFGTAGLPNAFPPDRRPGLAIVVGPLASRLHALVLAGGSAALLVAVAWQWARAARERGKGSVPTHVPFLLFWLGHFVFVACGAAARWPMRWHFVPEWLALAALPAFALGVLGTRVDHAAAAPSAAVRRSLGAIVAVTAAALGTWRAWNAWDLSAPPFPPSVERLAVEWTDGHLPNDAVLGSWDAGFIGFTSRFPVVNLDGLVNDVAYFRTPFLDERRLLAYVWENRITHLLNFEPLVPPDPGYFVSVPAAALERVAEWPWGPSLRVVLARVRSPEELATDPAWQALAGRWASAPPGAGRKSPGDST